MASSYWNDLLSRRLTRRRALATMGATAAGASLLAACGGIDEATDKSSFLAKPADSSSKAVPGGVWQTATTEPVSLDPNANRRTPDAEHFSLVYSNLLRYGRTTDGSRPSSTTISGDAAESFELAPDGLQVTLRLRPNHKFDPRPPTNGHAMTSVDVKVSWERTIAMSPFAPDLLHSRNEFGPVDSVSFPDDKTVVFKLAFPFRTFIEMLAYHTFFWIVPREAEQFNIKAETRGSGPFFLTEWAPSAFTEYKKNPDWYVKSRPFLDGIRATIIPDYPAALAQFEAGAIWDYAINQEDVLRTKTNHQEMVMTRNLRAPAGQDITWFMMASSREDSPLRDIRVRQAAPMLIDRDLYISTLFNTEAFVNAGVPTKTYWNNHLGGESANWLDPKTNAIGDGQKFFKFDPAEAKKLLSAAGYDKAPPQISYWSRGTGGALDKRYLIMGQMLRDGGLNLDEQSLETQTTWRQTCQASETIGQGWSGWCINTSGALNEAEHLASKYTPEGKFRLNYRQIPGITDLVRKARVELDANRQSDLIKQIQRELAVQWLDMPQPGYADRYDLTWPWLKNYGVFTDGGYEPNWSSSRVRTEYWYDASAKPS